MPEHYWSFDGKVDDAGGGIVTIVVDRSTDSYPFPGDEVKVAVRHVEPIVPDQSVIDQMEIHPTGRAAAMTVLFDWTGDAPFTDFVDRVLKAYEAGRY